VEVGITRKAITLGCTPWSCSNMCM